MLVPILLLAPGHSWGQEASSRPILRIDLEWFYASGSLPLRVDQSWTLGPEIGIGMGHALGSNGERFLRFTHLGVLATRKFGAWANLDLGVQGGIGEFRPPECSGLFGCYSQNPQWYGAFSLAATFGGRWWWIGPRVSAVSMAGDQFLAWVPLFGGFRF